jgi:hypothetical protein
MHPHAPSACVRERKAMQAAARSGKPCGYSWRLWNDPKAGTPRKVPTGSLHVPGWAHEGPAYKRILADENTNAAVDRRHALYNEWLAKREAA